MASEEAEAAVIVEAVAARARGLVVALLAPGGLLSVEDAGKTVADSVRSCAGRRNLAVRRQDVEKLAVAAAAATLTVIVIGGGGSTTVGVSPTVYCSKKNIQGGSLNAPHSVVEEAITEAVAAASAQVGGMGTSSACSSAFWCLVVVFFLWVTTIAIFVFCLGY